MMIRLKKTHVPFCSVSLEAVNIFGTVIVLCLIIVHVVAMIAVL